MHRASRPPPFDYLHNIWRGVRITKFHIIIIIIIIIITPIKSTMKAHMKHRRHIHEFRSK